MTGVQTCALPIWERLGNQGIDVGIHVGDFFEMPPRAKFDAVVGNPPYIRYQSFTGRQRAIAREDALRAGVYSDRKSVV